MSDMGYSPSKFTTLPRTIEAIRYYAPTDNSTGNVDIIQLWGAKVEPGALWDPPKHADLLVWNSSHDDWNITRPGDWVIQGIHGEFYPCEDTIFKQSYIEESLAEKEEYIDTG